MPVKMWTGKPGAGKTACMVAAILKFKQENPHRPVYAININGLDPSVAEPLTLEQLARWWELPPEALICIDEAQEDEFFPLDQGKPKEWVKRISKVRHEGMDFWFTTQHPDLVSAYVRRLVDSHVHSVRKFNSHVVSRFHWGRCMTSCEEPRAQKVAIHTVGTLPKEVFELYKSSNAHNMKRKIPLRAMVLPIAAVIAVAALVGVPMVLKKLREQTTHPVATAQGAPAGASSALRTEAAGSEDQRLRREDFAKWMKPRVDGLPWSAPMFDGLAVRAQPRLFCIAGEDKCVCQTEQGTSYKVDGARCRAIAAGGLYNPFIDGDLSRQDRQSHPRQASAAQPPTDRGGLPVASGIASGRMSRATATPYTPPEFGTWNPDALASGSR
jgi:hypothetical protein